MTTPFHNLRWSPITGLPSGWNATLRSAVTESHVAEWLKEAEALRAREQYQNFLDRLLRKWAIETGAIEDLYTLGAGSTLALIEKGFEASFIAREDTNLAPEDLLEKLRDQHEAILGLYDFVSGDRPLGTSYIKELHQKMTAHQPTHVGRDTLGNLGVRELPRGIWKTLPNNVEHPDGARFDYCPPEHVQSEMERLLDLHKSHEEAGVPPYISAAWLHHRFTLVHPFTDGNGRVARCLATLVLLKARWFPLVVTRDERADYVAALRAADAGDLKPLVDLFGFLQRRAVLEALNERNELVRTDHAVKGILGDVRIKLGRRRETTRLLDAQFIKLAGDLRSTTLNRLRELANEIQTAIADESAANRAAAGDAAPGSPNARWHYIQIVECAKLLGYFANLERHQAWARLTIETGGRFELLFSFHGIGGHGSELLGCAPMSYLKERGEDGKGVVAELTPLADEPFVFTKNETSAEVFDRFGKWLEECLQRGLTLWSQTL